MGFDSPVKWFDLAFWKWHHSHKPCFDHGKSMVMVKAWTNSPWFDHGQPGFQVQAKKTQTKVEVHPLPGVGAFNLQLCTQAWPQWQVFKKKRKKNTLNEN